MSLLFTAMKAEIPNGVAKSVFIHLVDRANKQNQCYPGMARLAKDSGFHRATVIRSIQYLEENGFISIQHRFENGIKITNLYTISTPINTVVAESDNVVADSNHVVADSNQGSSTEQLGVVAESYIEPPIKPPNETPIKRIDQSALDPDYFEMFWNAGMNKVGKKKACLAFKRTIKTSNQASEDFTNMLIRDIEKRLATDQLGFAEMHPTTYLNGERWADEYHSPQATDSTRVRSLADDLNDRSWADKSPPTESYIKESTYEH